MKFRKLENPMETININGVEIEVGECERHRSLHISDTLTEGNPGLPAIAQLRSEAYLPRTVNGTGHTGPSEFCATSL